MSLGVLTLCCQSQVLQQELHQVKRDLLVSQQAFAQAQEEQRQTDIVVNICAAMQMLLPFNLIQGS